MNNNMNRRSLLKAVVVAPVAGLGTVKAKARSVAETQPGVLIFKDIHQKIVVNQGFDAWIESIRAILEDILGIRIVALSDERQIGVIRFFACDADIYWSSFLFDRKEYKTNSPNERRRLAESRITSGLNELQHHFVACARMNKRLNLER